MIGEVFNGKTGGYFIDIGAADGVTYSNTLLLERGYQWRGLCIEADPGFYAHLKRVRRATCIYACVDACEREVTYVSQGLTSGIVDSDTDNADLETAGDPASRSVFTLRTRRLVDILREQRVPRNIDYLSLDVEGAEDRVFATFPFDDYQVTCMTIERPSERLNAILLAHGYMTIKQVQGFDSYYVHETFFPEYRRNLGEFWGAYSFRFPWGRRLG